MASKTKRSKSKSSRSVSGDPTKEIYEFRANTKKGYIPKTTFDALATSMNRVTLRLSSKGIFILEADCENVTKAHILWDVKWYRERFTSYWCETPIVIVVNAKHLQKMLRNVKKKDSLSFFISKSDPNKLGIIIQPVGAQADGHAARSEKVYLSIQRLAEVGDMKSPDKTKGAYGFPMVIGATDFQKIKKMAGSANTLSVKIQGSNYIAFQAGDRNVMSTDLTFGELTMSPNGEVVPLSDDDVEYDDDVGDDVVDDVDDDVGTTDDASSEYDEYSEEDEYPDVYEKDFAMSLFVPLVKLPGLTAQMEFYAPIMPGFPLKINMVVSSGLGSITVFVKDQAQIAHDEREVDA